MKGLRAELRRRSPIEWGIRILLAVVVSVAGYFVIGQSLAEALPAAELERAHRIAPWDARISAELARTRFVEVAANLSTDAISPDARRTIEGAELLAQSALRRDATAVSAAATLGLVAQVNGKVDDARRWFAYSQMLSRRDLPTQLWLIEDAVGRNDIPAALQQYDIALRTKLAVRDLLFPVLATASTDPTVASALIRTLSAKPLWSEAFVEFVSTNTPDVGATAKLFRALRGAGVVVPETAAGAVVDGLMANKQFDAAWHYYSTIRPGADRRRSRDPNFTAMLERPSQLDWIPASGSTGLSASIQRADQGGVFDFFAPPSVGGPLLQQFQLLPPGRYAIAGHSMGVDQPKSSLPYWILSCAINGHELGRVVVSNSSGNEGKFAGDFIVPSDCPVQSLVLMARASSGLEGLAGQIDRVLVQPVE